MPRQARTVIAGAPHHVTQRGNNRQDVFFADDDRRVYLDLLGEQCVREKVDVLAYCLMTNHVHLVATPEAEAALGRAVGRTHFRYTQYVNRLHERCGHLWQGRFHSCAMQKTHAIEAVRYVERNPVRARLTRTPWEHPWSSAAAHVTGEDPLGLLDMATWREMETPASWKQALQRRDNEDEVEALRLRTTTGRPLGSDRFIAKLETALNRRLRPLPVGRPKGTSNRKRKGPK